MGVGAGSGVGAGAVDVAVWEGAAPPGGALVVVAMAVGVGQVVGSGEATGTVGRRGRTVCENDDGWAACAFSRRYLGVKRLSACMRAFSSWWHASVRQGRGWG